MVTQIARCELAVRSCGNRQIELICRRMTVVLAATFTLIASISPALAAYPKVSPSSPLQHLTEEFFSDDYQGDEDPLATTDRTGRSEALTNIGWEYFNVGHWQSALRKFFLAIRMDETNAKAYFAVAYICSVKDNLDDAITFYREALKYEQKFAPIYSNLAKALLLKDKHSTEAPKLLDQALILEPQNPETYVTYSRYYADQDDWNNAAYRMNQATALGRQLDSAVKKDFKKHGIQLNAPPPQ